MTSLVLQLVVPALVGVVAAVVGARRARSRREQVRTGGTAACTAWLGSGAQRPRRGTLVLSGTRATWTRRGGRTVVELGGSSVLSAAGTPGTGTRPDDVVLRLALPWQATARLRLHRDDAATLVETLRGGARPAADLVRDVEDPLRRRPVWPLVCLALSAVWVAGWAVLVAGGSTVTARTTSNDGDGTCGVTWTGARGGHSTGNVTCADEPFGTAVQVFVLGWPVGGEPVDAETTEAGIAAVPVLVGLPGAVRLSWWWRRRRRPLPPDPHHALPVRGAALPELGLDQLRPGPGEAPADVVARLTPYARTQVPEDGWESPRRPHGSRSTVGPARLTRMLLPAVATLPAAVLLAWPWPARWVELHTAPTETVTATSAGDHQAGRGPFPGSLTVRFRTGGDPVRETSVATDRALPAGAAVPLVVSSTSTAAARLTGDDDDLARAAATGSLALVLSCGWTGWAVLRLGRSWRAVHRVAAEPGRPALGLLTADGAGEPLLLLCDPLVEPVIFTAVPLQRPLPHGTATALTATPPATVTAHGRLAAGGFLVVGAAPGTLLPAGPAARPDAAVVLGLLDSASALARAAEGEEPA